MDNGVPPTSKRVASRQAGSTTKSRANQPGDPRKEAATGGQPRPGQGHNGAGGNGAGNGSRQQPRSAKRRAGSAAPVDPLLPQAGTTDGAPRTAPSGDSSPLPLLTSARAQPAAPADVSDAGAPRPAATLAAPLADRSAGQPSATIVDEPVERLPLLLPPIVPAEPEYSPTTEPAAAPATPGLTPFLVPKVVAPSEPTTEVSEVHTDTDGTDGLPSLLRPTKPARALRAPKVMPRPRPRVRRVTRVVRHVDTWSVFKVALVFNLFIYAVSLTAGVLLWRVAVSTGTVDNIERFFESFGWQHFELKAGEIYHNAWVAGLFLVVGFTGLAVLLATMFNLITDLVGGIRISVLEEEVVVRAERATGWRRARRHQPFPPPRPLPREPRRRRAATPPADEPGTPPGAEPGDQPAAAEAEPG